MNEEPKIFQIYRQVANWLDAQEIDDLDTAAMHDFARFQYDYRASDRMNAGVHFDPNVGGQVSVAQYVWGGSRCALARVLTVVAHETIFSDPGLRFHCDYGGFRFVVSDCGTKFSIEPSPYD